MVVNYYEGHQIMEYLRINHYKKWEEITTVPLFGAGEFQQGLSEYDIMTLAGHANFETTHKFYLAIADDLIARARNAVTHEVSQELLRKSCHHRLRIA